MRPDRILPVFLPGLVFAALAQAGTLHVPADHTRIADALAAAQPGDVIQVAAGTYSLSGGEGLPLTITQGVSLIGAGYETTTIDAENITGLLTINTPGTVRVSGFTLTGGLGFNGGGVAVLDGTVEIDGNLVRDNGALSQGSGIYVQAPATAHIHHNVIWENYDRDLEDAGDPHGIQLNGAGGTVEHNLVGRHDTNGLFFSGGSEPVVRHNIFYENGLPGVRGRGICHFGGPLSEIYHNLFFGNEVAAILVGPSDNLDATGEEANDLSPTDAIYGNLDGNPHLADPDNGDWTLQIVSPAIDAGDPTLPMDPDGTVADLGPFFFDQSLVGVNPASPAPLLSIFPNPMRGAATIRVEDSEAVTIHDLRGRLVRRLDPTAGSVNWNGLSESGEAVPAGVYFVSTRGGKSTGRVVVVR